jgi:hypothetical protein
MRSLLTLLSLVQLSVALLGLALRKLILLLYGLVHERMRLQNVPLSRIPLSQLPFPVGVCLLRGGHVLLLERLRYARQGVLRTLGALVALRAGPCFRGRRSLGGLVGRRVGRLCCQAGQRGEILVVRARSV